MEYCNEGLLSSYFAKDSEFSNDPKFYFLSDIS